MEELLTTEDVAIHLKKTTRWVRESLIHTGLLPVIKIGREYRVRRRDLNKVTAYHKTIPRHKRLLVVVGSVEDMEELTAELSAEGLLDAYEIVLKSTATTTLKDKGIKK